VALIHICAVLALLLAADNVAAGESPRREIRFAVAAQFSPFQSRNPQGQLVGLNIDLGNALCVQLNVRCTWSTRCWWKTSRPWRPGSSTQSWAWRPRRRVGAGSTSPMSCIRSPRAWSPAEHPACCRPCGRSRASVSGCCWAVIAKPSPERSGRPRALSSRASGSMTNWLAAWWRGISCDPARHRGNP